MGGGGGSGSQQQQQQGFMKCSPTYLIKDFIKINGSNILPNMLLIHGALDDTVPYTLTTDFMIELYKGITDCHHYQQPSEKERFQMIILPEVGHADTVIQFMIGGETRDYILNWLSI